MVVGDLITAYHAGYHRVVGFHDATHRKDCPQVEYQTVLNATGKPVKSKRVRSCHVEYCEVVDKKSVLDAYDEAVVAAIQKRDAILAVLA